MGLSVVIMGLLHDADILGYMIHTYILDKMLLKGKKRCVV